MKRIEVSELYELRGMLRAQRDYYQERLMLNRKHQDDPTTAFSPSFLEGESRAFLVSLDGAGRAIKALTEIIGETPDA